MGPSPDPGSVTNPVINSGHRTSAKLHRDDVPIMVAEHPGQVRRQRLHPRGHPVGPLGQPPHLGPQPDDRDQADPDPHQPDNDQHHRKGLHGEPLSQCDLGLAWSACRWR
jgi:hypothetical protein